MPYLSNTFESDNFFKVHSRGSMNRHDNNFFEFVHKTPFVQPSKKNSQRFSILEIYTKKWHKSVPF